MSYQQYFFIILMYLTAIQTIRANYNIFLNAPPKAGNHLLAKTIRLLTDKKALSFEIAPTGIHWTHIDPRIISETSTDFYLCSHAFALPENIKALKETDCHVIFMCRDPRDELISLACFMKNQDSWPTIKDLALNDIITKLIKNFSILYMPDQRSGWGHPLLLSIKGIDDFYNQYIGWMHEPFVYTTYFEKLVGPQGGGSYELQIQEIRNIAKHIGITVPHQTIEWVAKNLFGESATFRKGQIGAWKNYFTQKHKELFKQRAGQLLIDLGYEKDTSW